MTSSLVGFVSLSLFLLPLTAVILLASGKFKRIDSLFHFLLLAMVAGTTYLAAAGSLRVTTKLTFLNEPLWLSFSRTPTTFFVLIVVLLWLLILAQNKLQGTGLVRIEALLLCLSLSFGYAAFFSGQFLMRYIALEMVGLLTALLTLSNSKSSSSYNRFGTIFILLRLGDLSLLVAILLMRSFSGTLDIDRMIETALISAPSTQAWILGGVLLAAVIKMAVWPFWNWMLCSEESSNSAAFWLPSVLIPSLGFYLLYRFLPLIQTQTLFQTSLILLASVYFLVFLVFYQTRLIAGSRFSSLNSLMGIQALFIAASGSAEAFLIYVSAMLFLRLLTVLEGNGLISIHRSVDLVMLVFMHGVPLLLLPDDTSVAYIAAWVVMSGVSILWSTRIKRQPVSGLRLIQECDDQQQSFGDNDHMNGPSPESERQRKPVAGIAEWLNAELEIGLFEKGISNLNGLLKNTAGWLYLHVEKSLDKRWEGVEQLVMNVSRLSLDQIEEASAVKAHSLLHQFLHFLGEQEKQIRDKPLRWDLLWIPLTLAIVLIFLLNQ